MKPILIPAAVCTALAIVIVSSAGAQTGDVTAAKLHKAAQGMLAYAVDNSETFPLAFPRDAAGQYRWNSAFRVPDLYNIDNQIWANSVRAYWGQDPLSLNGPTYPYNASIQDGSSVGIVMNGLLHTMSTAAVEKKGLVPLMWTPYGNQNMYGTLAVPSLTCHMPQEPCVFGKPAVMGVHFLSPKPIVPFGESLYAVTVDLSIRKPKAYAPLADWKTGVFVDNPKGTYAASMSKSTAGMSPMYFDPTRTE